MKFHVPDFGSDQASHPLDWYCNNPAILQFFNHGDSEAYWVPATSASRFNPGRNAEREVFVPFTNEDPKRSVPGAKRTVRSEALASQLIVSNVSSHSARALCESKTSYGPDFVSYSEQMFCDIDAKLLWPVCNDDEQEYGCFDLNAESLSIRMVGRDIGLAVRYVDIIEWS